MIFLSRLKRRAGLIRALPRQAYATISGWRFEDVKKHIDSVVSTDHDALSSMLTVQGAFAAKSGDRPSRLAVVTCLPPDESGIANFSMRHLAEFPEPVSIFSQVRDVSRHLYNATLLHNRSGGNAQLYPMGSLLAKDATSNFDKIVVVIGNSEHNLEAFRQLEHLSGIGRGKSICCYLHDPCCLNIVQVGKALSNDQMTAFVQEIYSDRALTPHAGPSWALHANLLKQGVLGVRAIYDAGAHEFIVNSHFAAELVKKDLGPERAANCVINVAFHPVLMENLAENSQPRQEDIRTIGSFGAPSEAKATEVIVRAVSLLNERGVRTNLLLAGYGARRYAYAQFGTTLPNWLSVDEPQTERELQLAMLKCDLAIQLRKESLGESSGVVPTLIGLGKTTIVSPVGAFSEYGDAVAYFRGFDALELMAMILNAPSVLKEAMATYSQKHSISALNKKILGILGLRTDRPKLAAYGSCHAQALQKFFEEATDAIDVVNLPAFFALDHQKLESFKTRTAGQLSWFVYQPISQEAKGEEYATRSILSHLTETASKIPFSYPHFELYNPYAISRAGDLPDIGFGYIDYAIGALVMNGRRGVSLKNFYRSGPDFNEYKDSLKAWCFTELKDREERVLPGDLPIDVKISGFIENQFRNARLFWSMNHPTNALLVPMFSAVADKMGVDVDVEKITSELLSDTVIPIPEYIAGSYDLKFRNEDFCRLGNVDMSLDEYVFRYEDYFMNIDPMMIMKTIEDLARSRPWFNALKTFGL